MFIDPLRRIRRFSCGTLVAALIIAAAGQASAGAPQPAPRLWRPSAAGEHPAVPRAAVLAETLTGRLLVISLSGRVLEHIPGRGRRPPPWAAIELAPDRHHAFVSSGDQAEPPSLYELNLRDGRKRFIAHGISPTLSPDHSALAYLEEGPVKGIEEVTALVLRDLRTNTERSIPFAPPRPAGTPPEQLLSWSPDGRLIALVTKVEGIALVDPTAATSIATSVTNTGSQASIAGLAPAFVDTNTLVVLANCCIGHQRLDD
jgi:hypothetical protein